MQINAMTIDANIPGEGYVRIEVEDDKIASVQSLGSAKADGFYVTPGFVDIQLNGFSGIDFSSPALTAQQTVKVLPSLWRTGVTTFCPTLITNSHARLLASLRVLEEARRIDADFASAVPCYHLEGPYLSPLESHGAHDPALMRPPAWDEFTVLQMAAGGRIGMVTVPRSCREPSNLSERQPPPGWWWLSGTPMRRRNRFTWQRKRAPLLVRIGVMGVLSISTDTTIHFGPSWLSSP